MSVVTTTSIKKLMMDNIIQFVELYVTDPQGNVRKDGHPFVFPKFSRVNQQLPQIMVEIGGGSASGTGLRNQMETHMFQIMLHAEDYDQVYSVGDELYNEMKKDTNDYFFDSKMYRPNDYIQPYRVYPHEDKDGTIYMTFPVKFDFFHFDA